MPLCPSWVLNFWVALDGVECQRYVGPQESNFKFRALMLPLSCSISLSNNMHLSQIVSTIIRGTKFISSFFIYIWVPGGVKNSSINAVVLSQCCRTFVNKQTNKQNVFLIFIYHFSFLLWMSSLSYLSKREIVSRLHCLLSLSLILVGKKVVLRLLVLKPNATNFINLESMWSLILFQDRNAINMF